MVAVRRSTRLRLALLALCTLLFAQWTLAAHACPIIGQAAVRIAQAQWAQELSDTAAAGCPFHTQASAADEGSPEGAHAPSPVCLKHCSDETSASNGLTIAADAPPPAGVLRVVPRPNAPGLRIDSRPTPSSTAGPPLLIQYCVSLT